MLKINKKPTPIHKTGLMHLPALSGEDLTKLNHPAHETRSEFSKNIRTYNMAVTSMMNRHLSQALRDTHTKIDGLNRSQQKTYRMMCKIIETKKNKAKETSQKYRTGDSGQQAPSERVRKKHHLPPLEFHIERKASQDISDDTPGGTSLEPGAEDGRDETLDNETLDIAQADGHKEVATPSSSAKTLQVEEAAATSVEIDQSDTGHQETTVSAGSKSMKDDQQISCTSNTRTQTGSQSGSDVVIAVSSTLPARVKPPTFYRTTLAASQKPSLPPITESADGSLDERRGGGAVDPSPNRCHQSRTTDLAPPKCNYPASTPFSSNDSVSEDVSTVISAKQALSLRAKISRLEQEHMKEFLRRQNLDTKPRPYQLQPEQQIDFGTHLNTLTGTTSESSGEGRKPTKARSVAAERRKLVKLRSLHRKAVLDSENNYIYQQLPGGGFMAAANAYKKKRFLPPSNKEHLERKKILKSIEVKSEVHGSRIVNFFDKLNIPIEEPPRKVEQKTNPDSEPARKSKDTSHTEASLPAIVGLTSLAQTAYIRKYVRPSDRDEYVPKVTSWSQSY